MRQFFIIILCLVSINLCAQTKKIAFKSHSGNSGNFNIALENDLFDMDKSNFGQAPTREIKTAQLDSVIFVSDSVAIMITSVYCTNIYIPKDDPSFWRAGKQNVYHHPLFSRQHSLDSIKNILRAQYNFRNPVEKIVFVGYDNDGEKDENGNNKITAVAVFPADHNQSSNDGSAIILGLIFGLSLLGGLVTWQYIQWREKRMKNKIIASI